MHWMNHYFWKETAESLEGPGDDGINVLRSIRSPSEIAQSPVRVGIRDVSFEVRR